MGGTLMRGARITISLDLEIAGKLRQYAAEDGVPASRYVARLVEQDLRRRDIEVAKQGYRETGPDTLEFAEAALPLALEVWPEWNEDEPSHD
jgi:hypothetical protein